MSAPHDHDLTAEAASIFSMVKTMRRLVLQAEDEVLDALTRVKWYEKRTEQIPQKAIPTSYTLDEFYKEHGGVIRAPGFLRLPSLIDKPDWYDLELSGGRVIPLGQVSYFHL